ncbi:uncharacterized protein LOC105697868 [Orussus abietinus]|uniref:uncharacterized protein LOC105697868 n=1 Tax=Orussus abietinus TaxID=222816 RepID=UPI0006269D8F|nr:uncharacterized protein LOC105697868 [Orussus abietinus]
MAEHKVNFRQIFWELTNFEAKPDRISFGRKYGDFPRMSARHLPPALPDGSLQTVNYVIDVDGYRADVGYDREEKPIVANVEDVPVEKDVYTRIAVQSANLAQIQSQIGNARSKVDATGSGIGSRRIIKLTVLD